MIRLKNGETEAYGTGSWRVANDGTHVEYLSVVTQVAPPTQQLLVRDTPSWSLVHLCLLEAELLAASVLG